MNMKRSILATLGLAFGLAASSWGQEGLAAPEQPTSTVEPDALAALDKMGTYLRTLKAFQVRATTTTEDGQKVQYAAVTDLLAQVPDRLRAEVSTDRKDRMYLYDGKTFTLFAPRAGYYATVPAPPTIRELADRLEERFDVEIPMVDLFRWGGPRSTVADIKAATDVGPSEVEGTTCEHYAFRQPGLDWQIWIQQGNFPLPRKLVITTTTDEARPQYASVYTWNLAPSFNDAAFTFDPPSDAQKIVFTEVTAAPAAAKK
jgi:hypothetical protein